MFRFSITFSIIQLYNDHNLIRSKLEELVFSHNKLSINQYQDLKIL